MSFLSTFFGKSTPTPASWKPDPKRYRAILKATIADNAWIKQVPTKRQALFLAFEGKESLYGGAAGGGKSSALLMTALQWVGLAVVVVSSPPREGLVAGCAACAAFALPINFLLFALDNLLFLLFPTRLMAATPGDFQALGRNVLFMVAKASALIAVAVAAALTGLAAWSAAGESVLAGLIAAWPVVAACAAALVPFVAWAFTLFDVGRDTPA